MSITLNKMEKAPHNMGDKTCIRKELSLVQYILAYQTKGNMVSIREHMVSFANTQGNQAAARHFECHRNTIAKWRKRYELYGRDGLKDQATAPHSSPNKIVDSDLISAVLTLRETTGYGSERLKHQFELAPSNMAIHRILREHNMIRKKRKTRSQTKQDLWAIKRETTSLYTKLQLDGKQLTDIPHYLKQYRKMGLPKWQFTLRDVKSGAMFLSFMSSENGANASAFLVYFFEHMKLLGIDVSKMTIQVDGASWILNLKSLKPTKARHLIEEVYGAKLKIVPGGKTKQSDVETVHRLMEDEFYDRQTFSSVHDFYKQAYTYLQNFNFIRKNRHKDWQTPWFFVNRDLPTLSQAALDLAPINLDVHHELYQLKINEEYITMLERLALDVPPDYLPCKDFSLEEAVSDFANRVINAFLKKRAHDLPIYPKVWLKFG
jgi:transposase